MELILSKIKDIIKEKGLTIYKLTELAGLSENTIYNWYNKGAEPTISALKAICPHLNVSLSYLVAEEESTANNYLEEELLRHFRSLPEKKKVAILNLIKEF